MTDGREPVGRVKACTECRQQKLRCDAYKDYSKPCSRCDQMGLACVVSKTFKRIKRQTKAELRKEIATLKRQAGLPPNEEEGQHDSDGSSIDYGDQHHRHHRNNTSNTSQHQNPTTQAASPHVSLIRGETPIIAPPYLPVQDAIPGWLPGDQGLRLSNEPQPISDHHQSSNPDLIGTTSSSDGVNPHPPSVSATDGLFPFTSSPSDSGFTSHSMGEIEVEGRKVLECFALFFQHYASFLPGLFNAEAMTPNEVRRQSDFLFWTIVCTGSRKYTRDPTIFDRISKRIVDLAASSICYSPKPIFTIQAILILCNWPIPLTTVFKDPLHGLGGAAMQLAIQNGLHLVSTEADFASKPTNAFISIGSQAIRDAIQLCAIGNNPNAKDEILFRMRLWANCQVILQRTSMCDGLPPTIVPELASMSASEVVQGYLPPDLRYRVKLHRLQIETMTSIRRDVDLENALHSENLLSMMKIFSSLILGIGPSNLSDLQLLEHSCARVSILAFHFFATPPNVQGFVELFAASCEAIQIASRMNESHSYLTHYHERMITLASYCILRIAKSYLNGFIAMDTAENCIFAAIELFRKRSVQDNDLNALNAVMLTKLWSSNLIFTQPDGTRDSLRLGLRGRMAMSVVFDCFYWWRREYGTLSNTKNPHDDSEMPNETARDSTDANSNTLPFQLSTIPTTLGFPTFDWDWTAVTGSSF